MSSIDLSPSEVVFILISSMIVVSFIVAKLSKKEGIEEEEKEKEKEEKKEEEKRKQFKKLSEECFLDIKNLSKYHKMMIYVDLFFSVLQNSNKESSLKEMEINRVFQTSEKLKNVIEDPNFQKVKNKIDSLPLEYKKQIVAALTKNNLFFEKDDDLQTFLVFLYLIMCIEFLIIKHGDSLLEYPEYKNNQEEVPDLTLLYFCPELEPTFGFMRSSPNLTLFHFYSDLEPIPGLMSEFYYSEEL